MTIALQDLAGAWKLVSAEQVFADGERRPEFGPSATGYLSYSTDGIVSATLGSMTRPRGGATDPQNATDADLAGMARDFIAYAGPFTIDADAGTVTHHIDIALFTGWQTGAQVRHVRVSGDTLDITGSPRTASDGRSFRVELVWSRVPAAHPAA
jgi:hypothetical protein